MLFLVGFFFCVVESLECVVSPEPPAPPADLASSAVCLCVYLSENYHNDSGIVSQSVFCCEYVCFPSIFLIIIITFYYLQEAAANWCGVLSNQLLKLALRVGYCSLFFKINLISSIVVRIKARY
jgi:hypothetical protein